MMETIVLFLLLSIARNVVSQQSPCPEVFRFESDGQEKFGTVYIDNIPEASAYVLEITFTARALIHDVSCLSFHSII